MADAVVDGQVGNAAPQASLLARELQAQASRVGELQPLLWLGDGPWIPQAACAFQTSGRESRC